MSRLSFGTLRKVPRQMRLDTIDRAIPDELELHLVLDNYATHKTPAIRRWLLRHPHFHVHFTPTFAYWLNLVEGGSPG